MIENNNLLLLSRTNQHGKRKLKKCKN